MGFAALNPSYTLSAFGITRPQSDESVLYDAQAGLAQR